MPRRKFLVALCLSTMLAGLAGPGEARSIEAKSGEAADIQAAVDQASTGDVILIPAGKFKFVGQVFAPDGITIQGAGRDSTFLIKSDDLGEWHAMITVNAKTGQPFRFSGITMQGRLDALQGSNRRKVVTKVRDQGLVILGAAKNIQIFNARFTKFLRAGIEFVGDKGTVPGEQTGVIYKNQFIDNWYVNLGYAIAINGYAHNWDKPHQLGTAAAIFVEDNLFDRNRHCVAASDGANYVARYNTIKDNYQDAAAFDAHGLSASWPRGVQSVEIYKNVVTDSIKRWAGAGIRGGSGVVWGNSWKGVTHGIILYLEIPRASKPLSSYPALDQIGNPHPLYIWNNISSGDALYKNPTTDPQGIDYWLQEGRDYVMGPKPGYTPYVYPHPLRAH
jgi:hypothetical protein